MNHSIVIRNVRISYWYFALLFLSCLFLSIRLVFNPTVSNSTDGFLYLIWNGPLSQVAIVISCISILYVDSKITGVLKSNLKANLISCCFAGAVLLLPICIVYLISLVLFPAPIIGYIPVSIRGTIWAEVYTLGNGKLMVLLIALLAFLGGCLWASVALTIAKALDKKIYGVLFAIILYHVINSLFIGTEMPFLAPHNLWFPTLASNIPIYIIALVQIVAIAMTIGILATWSQTRIGHHAQSNKANPKTFALIIAVAAIVYSVICIYPVFKAAATYGYGINVLEPICFLFSTEKSILILNTCCVAFVLIVLKEHDKTNCFVYILFCVVIFYFVLLIVLCILFISMGFISNDWSQFAYYYTHTSLSNSINYFQITFMPSYIAAFQPVGFLLTSTGLIMVFSLLCAVIIRVADDLLAFEDGIVVVLLLQEIWVTMCQLSVYIQFLSPFAHAIIGNHSFGYDYKPTITTSFYVLFSQIVFALLFDYIITVRKKNRLASGRRKKQGG